MSDNNTTVRAMVTERAGREWCLFLDRDGVINRRIVGDYVRNWSQFEWLPGAQLALKALRAWAPHLVIVTNQQGIGKGLMSPDDLAMIHNNLLAELAGDGLDLDGFQVCPHLESASCRCRKPRPGLILDWLGQHPDSEPSLSVMVGDSQSDLELAFNVATVTGGCASIQVGHESTSRCADASFDSLLDLALAVRNARGEEG